MQTLLQSPRPLILLLCTAACTKSLAQTTPFITAFQQSGQLTWTNVIPGHYYAVQAKGVFSQGWTNFGGGLDSLQATGTTMTVSVPVSASQMFFTVLDRGSCCQNNGGASLATAVNLGSVCGDQGNGLLTTSGCGNGWFRAHVSECDIGFFAAVDLRVRVTLQPPAGTDYDLYVYRPDGSLLGSSTGGMGQTDFLNLLQPDSAFPDPGYGVDNSVDFIIEVRRWLAFPCMSWSLEVRGNFP